MHSDVARRDDGIRSYLPLILVVLLTIFGTAGFVFYLQSLRPTADERFQSCMEIVNSSRALKAVEPEAALICLQKATGVEAVRSEALPNGIQIPD